MSKCRCIRTATAADDRAYRAAINSRGGTLTALAASIATVVHNLPI